MTATVAIDQPAAAPTRSFTVNDRGVIATDETRIDVVLWWGDCGDPAAPGPGATRYFIEEHRPDGTAHHAPVDGGYLQRIHDDEDLMTRVNADLRMLYGPHLVMRWAENKADWIDFVDLTRDPARSAPNSKF